MIKSLFFFFLCILLMILILCIFIFFLVYVIRSLFHEITRCTLESNNQKEGLLYVRVIYSKRNRVIEI